MPHAKLLAVVVTVLLIPLAPAFGNAPLSPVEPEGTIALAAAQLGGAHDHTTHDHVIEPLDGCIGPMTELPAVGMACRDASGLWRVPLAPGKSVLTHGADSSTVTDELAAELLARVKELLPTAPKYTCAPEADYHAYLIYAVAPWDYDPTEPDRIREMFYATNAFLAWEAAEFGQRVTYKVACDEFGVPKVGTVFTDGLANFGGPEAYYQGYANPFASYWMWTPYEYPGVCGVGTMGHGDASGNGPGPHYGTTFGGHCGWFTMMHENGHNQGAVLDDAFLASGAGHCHDGQDIMCYDDDGDAFPPYDPFVCAERTHFDCNHDTYFNPLPGAPWPVGSWNLGWRVNGWLNFCGGASPQPIDLVLCNPLIPPWVRPTAQATFELIAYNSGNVTAENATVQLYADGVPQGVMVPLGDIEPGRSATANVSWQAGSEEGVSNLRVVLSTPSGDGDLSNNEYTRPIRVIQPADEVNVTVLQSDGARQAWRHPWRALEDRWWDYGQVALHFDTTTAAGPRFDRERLALARADLVLHAEATPSALTTVPGEDEREALLEFLNEGHAFVALGRLAGEPAMAPLLGVTNQGTTCIESDTPHITVLDAAFGQGIDNGAFFSGVDCAMGSVHAAVGAATRVALEDLGGAHQAFALDRWQRGLGAGAVATVTWDPSATTMGANEEDVQLMYNAIVWANDHATFIGPDAGAARLRAPPIGCVGYSLNVTGVIHNYGSTVQPIDARLELDGQLLWAHTFDGPTAIPPRGQATINIPYQPLDLDFHTLRLSAKGSHNDTFVANDAVTRPLETRACVPPGAPTSLETTTGPRKGMIGVSWAAPLADGGAPVLGYIIERTHNGTTTTWTVDADVTSFDDTGLEDGQTYEYTVFAFHGGGSAQGATREGTTYKDATPRLTSFVGRNGPIAGMLRLEWSHTSGPGEQPATYVRFYRNWTDGPKDWSIRHTMPPHFSSLYRWANLSTPYHWDAFAENEFGQSDPITITTAAYLPGGVAFEHEGRSYIVGEQSPVWYVPPGFKMPRQSAPLLPPIPGVIAPPARSSYEFDAPFGAWWYDHENQMVTPIEQFSNVVRGIAALAPKGSPLCADGCAYAFGVEGDQVRRGGPTLPWENVVGRVNTTDLRGANNATYEISAACPGGCFLFASNDSTSTENAVAIHRFDATYTGPEPNASLQRIARLVLPEPFNESKLLIAHPSTGPVVFVQTREWRDAGGPLGGGDHWRMFIAYRLLPDGTFEQVGNISQDMTHATMLAQEDRIEFYNYYEFWKYDHLTGSFERHLKASGHAARSIYAEPGNETDPGTLHFYHPYGSNGFHSFDGLGYSWRVIHWAFPDGPDPWHDVAPPAPTNLVATPGPGPGQLTLRWDQPEAVDPEPAVHRYEVVRLDHHAYDPGFHPVIPGTARSVVLNTSDPGELTLRLNATPSHLGPRPPYYVDRVSQSDIVLAHARPAFGPRAGVGAGTDGTIGIIAGGFNVSGYPGYPDHVIPHVGRYDIATGGLTMSDATLPEGRRDPGVAVFRAGAAPCSTGCAYIVGGAKADGQPAGVVLYDLATDALIPTGATVPLRSAQAFAHEGQVIAVGRAVNGAVEVWRYDPITNLASVIFGRDATGGELSAAMNGSRLFIFGGTSGNISVNGQGGGTPQVFEVNVTTGAGFAWPTSASPSAAVAAWHNGRVYVTAGTPYVYDPALRTTTPVGAGGGNGWADAGGIPTANGIVLVGGLPLPQRSLGSYTYPAI